jgi:uncharacterized protein (DUF3820 family)
MTTQQSAASYLENPPSYTDRLIDYVQNSGVSSDIVSASIALIRSFRQQVADEYKIKQTEKKTETDPRRMTYGKYNGRTIDEIAVFDKPYLVWISKQSFMESRPEHLQAVKSLLV